MIWITKAFPAEKHSGIEITAWQHHAQSLTVLFMSRVKLLMRFFTDGVLLFPLPPAAAGAARVSAPRPPPFP